MFNGTHPSLIIQLKERLPLEFADLTDDMVLYDLLPGKTLQGELQVNFLVRILPGQDSIAVILTQRRCQSNSI